MKNDSVPRESNNSQDEHREQSCDGRSTVAKNDINGVGGEKSAKKQSKTVALSGDSQKDEKSPKKEPPKKKKKHNTWPFWAMIISFIISVAVNVGSELALDGSVFWIATILTLVIMVINVIFDMISMAVTTCDIEPFLAMASRKVRGAKTAVKLAKKADVVSSICGDIVGDICGVVSGVCSASIAAILIVGADTAAAFWIAVLVTAVISTMTITMKAIFKKVAVDHANDIIFGVAKLLAFFKKDI